MTFLIKIDHKNILIFLIFYLASWSGCKGQSCSQNQLNTTVSCYSNAKSKIDILFNDWPDSDVLPNISNALVSEICKFLNDTSACTYAACEKDPQLAHIKSIGDYLCKNSRLINRSDCIQNVRQSNNQSLVMCNYLSTEVSAMKNQMTSVMICDYYKDASSCAFDLIQNSCGNETSAALMGLFEMLAKRRIRNCTFEKCDSGSYCKWSQSCRSSRTCACATVCAEMSEPTCGNNGQNYASQCLMRNDACKNGNWLIKRPQIYCDMHASNFTCDDRSINSIMNCVSPLYVSLINTLSSTGSFFFTASNKQISDTCIVYSKFKSCIQNETNECVFPNIHVLEQFYDYLCSSEANIDLTHSIRSACRQGIFNDVATNECVKWYNTSIQSLPYFGLDQYPFSVSEEMTSVCSITNDLYNCAIKKLKSICDQSGYAVFQKLWNGTLDLFQQTCNQGCKATMGDTYGVISTNNWPYIRNNGVSKCTWHIQVPKGLNVNLLAYPDRPYDCIASNAKFINVYSGDKENPNNLIGSFCPNSSMSRVISTSQSMNEMTVIYSSISTDGSRAPDFLAIYYAGLDACASNPCKSGSCVNELGGYVCRSTIDPANIKQRQDSVSMCNQGYTKFETNCYMAIATSGDQPTAEQGCKTSGGGHLTTITSVDQNNFVRKLASDLGMNSLWIGLRLEADTTGGQVWKWLSQEGLGSFAPWNIDNPKPNAALRIRCVIMNVTAVGRWETKECYGGTYRADGYVCRMRLLDYCDPNPCKNNGSCASVKNGAVCACKSGWTGPDCRIPSQNACSSSTCKNGATCTNIASGGFMCTCALGYMGTICDTDINECASNPCLNGGTCQDGIGRFTCTCAMGFSGSRCENANNPCSPSPCQNGGTCVTTSLTTYRCTCPAMYSGQNCTILMACSSNPCKNGATCTDSPSSPSGYMCTCPAGYAGQNCDVGSDMCVSMPCQNAGTCRMSGGTFACTCVAGWTGQRCETNINECISSPCLNGGTCQDGVNEYSCVCARGWSGSTCNQQISNCEPNPCHHGGTCVALSTSEFICKCAEGWIGSQCERDNDECSYNPCSKETHTCQNTYGSYRCTPINSGSTNCDSGWDYGQNSCYMVITSPTRSMSDGQKYCVQQAADLVSIRNVDERNFIGKLMAAKSVDRAWIGAMANGGSWSWTDGTSWSYTSWYTNEPKDSTGSSCVRIIGGYGFSWDTASCTSSEAFVCKKFSYGQSNTCNPNPCVNGGVCVNLGTRYECNCPSGYSGTQCQTSNGGSGGTACTSSTCQNGGTCLNGKCVCKFGWTGSTCGVPCPAGWSWSNSMCYFGVNNPQTYDQAVSFCPRQQTGSYLLTTQTQQEFDYADILMNQLQSNVWLGLKYNPGQSQFVWVTGSPLSTSDYKGWGPNQPASPQTKQCGRITGQTGFIWETEDCSKSMRFICKYAG